MPNPWENAGGAGNNRNSGRGNPQRPSRPESYAEPAGGRRPWETSAPAGPGPGGGQSFGDDPFGGGGAQPNPFGGSAFDGGAFGDGAFGGFPGGGGAVFDAPAPAPLPGPPLQQPLSHAPTPAATPEAPSRRRLRRPQLALPRTDLPAGRPAVAGYAFSGAGALLVTVAAATALAIPELKMFAQASGTLLVAVAAGLAAVGAAVLLQSVRCGRRMRGGRMPTLIGCALLAAAAGWVWIAGPGSELAWLSLLLRVAATGTALCVVVTVLMLLLPAGAPDEAPAPPPAPVPAAAGPPPAPAAPAAWPAPAAAPTGHPGPGPGPGLNPMDFDPFGPS